METGYNNMLRPHKCHLNLQKVAKSSQILCSFGHPRRPIRRWVGEMCGAESRTHCLFRIGETFRRRGFGANFGFCLERGDVPNHYFRFGPCITIPFIKVGVAARREGVAVLLGWWEWRRNRWQAMSQIALSHFLQSLLQW